VYTIKMKRMKKIKDFWKMSNLVVLLVCLVALFFIFSYVIKDDYSARHIMPPPPTSALYLDTAQPIEVRVADLLSYMTIEEKIGQMTLVEKNSIEHLGDIQTYHLGALLSGSGAKPEQNTPAGWKEMIDIYQTQAGQTRLGIPLLYGADGIHGHAHVASATVFPHAVGLGATNNAELVSKIANATAEELFATGVNWNFSPNLDQPLDIRWGRVYEAFSDDPNIVSNLGVAYIQGLQKREDFADDKVFVLATPKHYLGLGSMEWGTSLNESYQIDQGVTSRDETLLRARHLVPFEAAVEAGALSIMVGLNSWGDRRMVLQKELLTDLLKDELGYKGFLVSDWYGVHEGRRNTFWASVQAINAGVDMVMLPFDYQTFTKHIKWAHRLGLISDERINDAVGRILYAKFSAGLFDGERDELVTVQIPNDNHRALAQEAVAQSLVLLKNQAELLPLSPSVPHIRVAGSAADNIGRQVGAWTIEWQGIDGNWLAGATSILEGIKTMVGPGTTLEYNRLGNFSSDRQGKVVGIAVVGEKPYAEGVGDVAHPILDNEDLLAIKNLQASCDQVVVVVVAGRPLLIANEIESLDALVMAWLPGSEGQGVAEVLFGAKPFTGTLPLPWPKNSEQLPISAEGLATDQTPLLFPRGFGLR